MHSFMLPPARGGGGGYDDPESAMTKTGGRRTRYPAVGRRVLMKDDRHLKLCTLVTGVERIDEVLDINK